MNMSKFVDKSRSTGNPTRKWSEMEDDDDDKTVNSGGSEKNGDKMAEIQVKWCINNITDKKEAKMKINEILMLILQVHNTDVTIIDHNAREFTFDDSTTDLKQKEAFEKESKIPIHQATAKSKRRLNRWYATHSFGTSISLSTIKNHFLVREIPNHPPIASKRMEHCPPRIPSRIQRDAR